MIPVKLMPGGTFTIGRFDVSVGHQYSFLPNVICSGRSEGHPVPWIQRAGHILYQPFAVQKIIEKIGSGGGGIVYLGRHLRLEKLVVLKADKRTISAKPEVLRSNPAVQQNRAPQFRRHSIQPQHTHSSQM